jgi:hypothetical protein
VKALQPGDTLVVLDGQYTRGTNGMPVIDCANGARNGNGRSADHDPRRERTPRLARQRRYR